MWEETLVPKIRLIRWPQVWQGEKESALVQLTHLFESCPKSSGPLFEVSSDLSNWMWFLPPLASLQTWITLASTSDSSYWMINSPLYSTWHYFPNCVLGSIAVTVFNPGLHMRSRRWAKPELLWAGSGPACTFVFKAPWAERHCLSGSSNQCSGQNRYLCQTIVGNDIKYQYVAHVLRTKLNYKTFASMLHTKSLCVYMSWVQK